MPDDFVHFHVHTEYSLLDGHTKIPELVVEAARLGQRAVGISDHGTPGGAYQLWSETSKYSIKPIIGIEFYVAPESLDTKEPVFWSGDPDEENRRADVGNQGAATHLTVIADGPAGLRNLFRLHALSYSRGFYRKPRIDVPTLESHKDGLIILSGCLGSELQTRIKLGQLDEAHNYMIQMVDMFGDSFYVELMSHGIEIEKDINNTLVELADHYNVPTVATNDSHYTHKEDAYAHDAMLCLQTYAKLSDSERFRFEGTGYHLRSLSEMSELPLPSDSLVRTLEIAERVQSYDEVFEYNLRLPQPEVSLRDEAYNGLYERWDDPYIPEEYTERIDHEVSTIEGVGASGYMLTKAHLIKLWKEKGIRVGPGRGSASGSLVAYALGITALDPVAEGLLFERFMDPSRVGLPDIDTDIQDSRRDEAIQIAEETYGHDRVARVCTYGTEKAKAALKDAARVLGYTYQTAEMLATYLPPAKFGRSPKLSEFTGDSERYEDVLELAEQLEDTVRTRGVHAAGIVISPVDLTDQLPLWVEPPTKKNRVPQWITTFSNKDTLPTLDKMGLVKYDFLGLKALDVIDATLSMCKLLPDRSDNTQPGPQRGSVQHKPLSFEDLPTNTADCTDEGVYDLLKSGFTLGVFQLDSPGMQLLLRSLQPKRFADISAVLALYRPGPMGVNAHHSFAKRANGRESISYPHSEYVEALEPILGDTYGLIVYQEQVLETLKAVGGYDMTSASSIFYAMRKKLTEKMNAAKPDFQRRLSERGYSQDAVDSLWFTLVPFSDYSFNRSHCAGYGLIAYWTAYLKVHYPTEYMCALLSREEDPDKLREYLREAERMGIPILPPDINTSLSTWTPTDSGIRYGLSSIKGVGEKAFNAVTAKRPYSSLTDFYSRAGKTALNGATLGALIGSGAFDKLCPFREEHLLAYPDLTGQALADRSEKAKGAVALVRPEYGVLPAGLYNGAQRKALEAELLGVQLTQLVVRGNTSRPLDVDEIEYLHMVAESSPGQQPLILSFGDFTVQAGTITLTEYVRQCFSTMGVELYEA